MHFLQLPPDNQELLKGAAQLILDYLTPECLLPLYEDEPCFLAVEGDRVVGVSLISNPPDCLGECAFGLESPARSVGALAVREELRGQGLGEELLGFAIRQAFDLGVTCLLLEARLGQGAGALGICRRVSSRSLGVYPGYYADGSGAELFVVESQSGLDCLGEPREAGYPFPSTRVGR